MKKDIVLSIVVGSIMAAGMTAYASAADAPQPASKVEHQAPTSSGKCASGKCGTEKIYVQAKLEHDPQDQLVRTRDGKCGPSGQGFQTNASKCINGVCGK